ncbi:MAG: SUMF1/EgtB/PvdO family nonheme iron enzyme [Muribaculaceae bacterium]|nr:SUMF1/EgtB/PvdO family nonheme iron enzyme [Muribaculaceae bacterium]MBQ7853288.1 SUMF1/EgtB/PvdO family nonheme iron enzyme [Muribaculaceae bacterium]MBQ7853812.1 SUMF1/EgtB/PvdO family nonheme iron enzyme [Muribaculaceae bacterium]
MNDSVNKEEATNCQPPQVPQDEPISSNSTSRPNNSSQMQMNPIAVLLMSLAIITLLCICGYLLYDKYIHKGENSEGPTEVVEENATDTIAQELQSIEETINGVSFKMIKVKGGAFNMGSSSGAYDEQPVHQVTLDDYYIGETEVTQSLWEAVMGINIDYYRCQAEYDFGWVCDLHGFGPEFPMYYVSWNDCVEFVAKLNELTGKTYSLPTEAQWEYAARGGAKSQGYIYSGSDSANDVAWFGTTVDRGGTCFQVKTKNPNELGIYDMSGNVREWCNDRYSGNYYSISPSTEPKGPSTGTKRVLRGGSWRDGANDIRVTKRFDQNTSKHYNRIGLRVVLNGVK